MKLPTLNVDLKINAKNFKRDAAAAGKSAAGVIGLGGSKTGLGNALGSMLGSGLGINGLSEAGTALQLGFKSAQFTVHTAQRIMSEFNASVHAGAAVMENFNQATDTRASGLNIVAASRLAAKENSALGNEFQTGGLMDTFIGAGMGTEGQTGGIAGWMKQWAQDSLAGLKSVVAVGGGLAGGKSWSEAQREGDMATARSQGGAQAYATKAELLQQHRQFTQQNKYIREITS